jgi:hypothetical protein
MSPASISIDLDNQWAYMKTQGCTGWEAYPSYLDRVVPRILETLHAADLRATFFIVGHDAGQAENRAALRSITEAGHEIANHSFMHEPWLHLYSDAELRADFDQSEAAIREATGQQPRGFRGPGFSSSAAVRSLLMERGYEYDASSFPTYLGGLARAYFFMTSQLPPEEKKRRSKLYGSLRDGLAPLKPWQISPGLMELPVTTMPLLRTPVHMTYLLFLGQFSMPLARVYWDSTMQLCRLAGIGPSLLLHPTDFLDVTDVPEMSFFPAMRVPADQKIALVRHTLSSLCRHWTPGAMLDHARAASTASAACPTTLQKAVA